MTKAFLACLLSILCITPTPSFAIKPVSNKYAGVFLGPTYTPNISFNFNPNNVNINTIATFFNVSVSEIQSLFANKTLPNRNIPGTLKYSLLGGVGVDFGYRICSDYRLEGEIFYNNNPFSELTIGNYTIDSSSSSTTIHIGGDTNTAALLFNFLYDIPIQSKDGYAALRPYIGGGLGYAYIFSTLEFHYGENTAEQAQGAEPATLYESSLKQTRSAFAVQGIIGISYFIDDFCWLSLDGRVLTTPIKTNVLLETSGINFQSQVQLYSVMLGFHGAFSRG